MIDASPHEIAYPVVVATRTLHGFERVAAAAILWAVLVAAAVAQAGPTTSTACRAKADVCGGNCAVRLRHSPELSTCRQGCRRRKVECLRTGTWRPLLSGQDVHRDSFDAR